MGIKGQGPLVGLSLPNDGKKYALKRSGGVATLVEVVATPGGEHTHPLSEITDDGTMASKDDAQIDGKAYGRKSGGWAEVSEPGHSHALPAHATLHNGGADPVTPAGIGAAAATHSHGDYQATSAKGQANGYAGLDVASKVPAVNLGGAGGDASKYLAGDQSWKTMPTGEQENLVVLGVDRSNNTTAFADATGLSFTATATKTYLIEFTIWYTANATTTGINLGVNGSVALGALGGDIVGFTAATTIAGRHFNTYDESGKSFSASLSGTNFATVRCLYKAGASNTTFTLRFAAESGTTGTSVTIKAGSTLRYRQVD